jgi:phage terminase large subunit GpA-like protein
LKKRKYNVRKYIVPEYIKKSLELLKPPEELTVSEWAGKYRFLDERSSSMPGKWKNEMTPYLVGIMDEFNNYQTEKIVFCKCTQLGGTEALNNMICFSVAQDPAPMMIVYPTSELADSVVEQRIKPMLKASKETKKHFKEKNSSKKELQFDNMYISIVGSNSPSELASRPIRYLFLDEVDKYPNESKKEADPISLAVERTKTFNNRKIYMCSTPTTRTGHIWEEKEKADIEKHYFVPCPHCGEFIELKFSQIRWPDDNEKLSAADKAEFAQYICQECGNVINDSDKMEMLQKGKWETVKENTKFTKTVAFWINTLYSPFTRFAQIAKAYLIAKDDTEALHNFTNSWLAEPWEDTKLKTNAETVMERQTDLPEFVVPEWTRLLTAGVDVQETSLYYIIRAWGEYLTSQLITRGQVTSFRDIERIMNLEYMKPDGTVKLVDLCLIDSGDQTDEVYDFAAMNSEWCLPSKGTSSMINYFKLSSVNKTSSKAYGMTLALVDGGKYKDMIAGRMKRENGTGSWMVFDGIDLEYCTQVTAEHKITEKGGGGKLRTRWVQKTSHADNHYLDCEVYGMAAADILGVRSLFLQDNNHAPVARDPIVNSPPQRQEEEQWIKQDNSWI